MGGCASTNTIVSKSDVQVRKIKLSQQRLKQRDEIKKQADGKQNLYFGKEVNDGVNFSEYVKQRHLLGNAGLKNNPSFMSQITFDSKQFRLFQPMLKNMVLDYQEQFPRWLISDEQFRDDQMQEFIQKCQDTAKLQSMDTERDGNQNDEDEDDENNKQQDSIQNLPDNIGKSKNENRASAMPKISQINIIDIKTEQNEDENDNSFASDDEQLLRENSKKKHQQNQFQKGLKGRRKSDKEIKQGPFTKSKSVIEEKSQVSKKSILEDSDSNNSSDNDEKQKGEKAKFKDIDGLRGSSKNHSKLIQHSRMESLGDEGFKGSQQSGQLIPSLKIIKQDGQTSSNGVIGSSIHKNQAEKQVNNSKRGARASNGSNHYVIKEFKILSNDWVHTAICKAEIKTPTSLLEFKRRYFYEFDKMSAFLAQLLALKRMDFPNLLTFSYVQIGEASYSGDPSTLKKKSQAIVMPSQSNQGYNLKVLSPDDKQNPDLLIPLGQIQRLNKKTGTLLIANSLLAASQKINGSNTNTINNKEDVEEEDEDEEEESRLIMYVDRIFPECGKNLQDSIFETFLPSDDICNQSIKGFQIFDTIANTLCKMHRAGFSYRVLNPQTVRIFSENSKEFTAYLDSPDFIWGDIEKAYLQKYVQTESDFMRYDCKCLSALMIYYFFKMQIQRRKSRDALMDFIPPPNNQIQGGNLNAQGSSKNIGSQNFIQNQNPTGSYSFAEILSIQDQSQLDHMLKKLKLPEVIFETLKDLAIADINQQKPIEEFSIKLKGVLEKGPQTAFKYDSLSAYLSYHGTRPLKNENMHVYFRRKNQVHFYEFESKTFKVIKLMRKKAKFPVRTHLSFCHYDNCFYFFAALNSNKLVKFPLNTNSKQRHVINQKSEVIFFKSIKNIQIEEPQILSVIPDDYSFSLYIFNNKKNTDNETNDVYYNSYIVSITYTQEKPQVDNWKEKIQGFY